MVDEPTVPYEPRPAPGRQPDTICDGWTTPDFVVRMASVRGHSHRFKGEYRQDDAGVVAHARSGAVIFAVMDGVSGAPHSHLGARAAGQGALETLQHLLDQGGQLDWGDVLHAAADALLRHPRHGVRQEGTAKGVERQLGTTLVAGLIRPTTSGPVATLVRVGDSGAWLLRESRFTSLFEPKGVGRDTVSSAVVALPRLPRGTAPVEIPVPAGSVLLVGTDGIGDPLGDGTGLVGGLLAEVLRRQPPPLGLAHTIDFSRDTFDDDRTLVAIWPR